MGPLPLEDEDEDDVELLEVGPLLGHQLSIAEGTTQPLLVCLHIVPSPT